MATWILLRLFKKGLRWSRSKFVLCPRQAQAEMLPDSDTIPSVRDVLRRERCSLLQAGVAMLLYALCQTSLPIIMLMVILCVETTGTEFQWLRAWTNMDSLIYWLLSYSLLQAAAAVANHWQLHASFHVGQRVRAQLIMLVFRPLS